MKTKALYKFFFHKDTAILVAGLLFLWFGGSLFYDRSLQLEDLHAHQGRLAEIRTEVVSSKNKPLYKEITWEVQFFIDEEKEPFTTIAQYSSGGFQQYFEQVRKSDVLHIYTRNKPLGFIGIGSDRAIKHLVNATTNQTVIDITQFKEMTGGGMYICFIASFGFLLVYTAKTQRRLL